MRYLISGKHANGLVITEYCNPESLGSRIQELQDIEIEIFSVTQSEVYGEGKIYSLKECNKTSLLS